IRFRDRDVVLAEGEMLVVPRGVEHLPVAEEEAHVLLFEPASSLNTGNVTSERAVRELGRLWRLRRSAMRPGTREAAGARASWEPAASDLAPDVLADVGDLLLRLALDLVDAALDVGRVVVGQVAPGLLDLALSFVEDAFGALLGGGPLAVH